MGRAYSERPGAQRRTRLIAGDLMRCRGSGVGFWRAWPKSRTSRCGRWRHRLMETSASLPFRAHPVSTGGDGG
jgi:hypothetical protein